MYHGASPAVRRSGEGARGALSIGWAGGDSSGPSRRTRHGLAAGLPGPGCGCPYSENTGTSKESIFTSP